MASEQNDNFRLVGPKALEDRSGKFAGGMWVPYESVSEANAMIEEEERHRGLVVLIADGTSLKEYWYKDGITNAHLVEKSSGGGVGTETDPTVGVHIKAITTTNISNWETAYNKRISGFSLFSGGGTAAKTLRIALADGTNYDASFDDMTASGGSADGNNFPTSLGFSGGTLTMGRSGLTDLSVSLDGRYLQSFTESDPTVPAHVKGITTTNISNWNTAFTNSHTHANKTLLDSLVSNGNGGSFLANDGTYKPIASYTFSNGLTNTGNAVKLGGTLTDHTTVDIGAYYFNINSGNLQNPGNNSAASFGSDVVGATVAQNGTQLYSEYYAEASGVYLRSKSSAFGKTSAISVKPGRIDFEAVNYYFDITPSDYDTTEFKPLVVSNVDGRVGRMTDWPSSGGSYTLPIASTSTLGGIKVGTGLSIAGDGTLSATGGGGSSQWSDITGGISYANHVGVGVSTIDNAAGWARVFQVGNNDQARFLINTSAIKGVVAVHKDGYYGSTGPALYVGTESNHELRFIVNGSTVARMNGSLDDGTGVARMMTVTNGVFGFQNIPSGSSYTLPIASASVLGGIKVGSGLAITGDGTLYTTGGGGGGSSQWSDHGNGIAYQNEVMIGGTTDRGAYPLQVNGETYTQGLYSTASITVAPDAGAAGLILGRWSSGFPFAVIRTANNQTGYTFRIGESSTEYMKITEPGIGFLMDAAPTSTYGRVWSNGNMTIINGGSVGDKAKLNLAGNDFTSGQFEMPGIWARKEGSDNSYSIGLDIRSGSIQTALKANVDRTIEIPGLNDNTGVARMATVTNGVFGFQNIPSGGGGGGDVASVFGRTGAVTAQSGDYSSFYSVIGHGHAISDITGLQTSLDGTVKTTGAQTISGVKTFDWGIDIPDLSYLRFMDGSTVRGRFLGNSDGMNVTSPSGGVYITALGGRVHLSSSTSRVSMTIPTFASDAAAGTGGLSANDIYKTSTGELRIKL